MTQAKIDILLATWNGERFLAEQIDSILAQTVDDWRLIARDDGSSDRSLEILKEYSGRYPDCILVLEDGDSGLGACGNFARLMENSDAEYIMFCDQDDVWIPEKIEILLRAMGNLETEYGNDMPLLVHSDLVIVSEDLQQVSPSFWNFQGLKPSNGQLLNRSLIQNVVTGCASMCNRKLVDVSLPIPAEAMMHDWWLALVAASFGRTLPVPDATVFYRQHGGNALGARNFDLWAMLLRGFRSPRRAYRRTREAIGATEQQARAFLDRYGDQLPGEFRNTVTQFASLSEQGFIERRVTIVQHRFLTNGRTSKLHFLLFV